MQKIREKIGRPEEKTKVGSNEKVGRTGEKETKDRNGEQAVAEVVPSSCLVYVRFRFS